jgi:bifunctional enzyme CysN/CysC
MPSGRTTSIAQILMPSDADNGVQAGRAITFTLAQETDCGRGSLVCAQSSAPQMADAFVADLVWMAEDPLLIGQRFWLKIGANITAATVIAINHRLDIDTGRLLDAEALELNAIGEVVIETAQPFAFEPYAKSQVLGGFVLIDRFSNATLAAGMIVRSTNLASENLHWQYSEIDAEARADLKGQFPLVVWLTGLSGAGKSTIANLAEKRLFELGHHTYLLEGDNLRYGLNRDLAFSSEDRRENIRRAGEVARLMTDAGLIVIAAFISPFRADRAAIRQMMPDGRFLEVHVHVSLEEAEKRDPKGLYQKARSGNLKGFTGIDSPYEPAVAPEMYIDTQTMSASEAADQIVAQILALQAKQKSARVSSISSTDTP